MKDDNFLKKYKYDHNEFTKHGFRGYHRYWERINAHMHSRMHRNAVGHCTVSRGFNNNQRVNSQLNAQLETDQANNREYLKLVFKAVRLLAKQGLAYRGKNQEESNFKNLLDELIDAKGNQSKLDENNEYTCSEIQNEIIKLFYNAIMRKIMANLEENGHYCMLADEASDSSNSELLSLVVRQVTKEFAIEEHLLGYYKLDNIKSEHVADCIKVS